MGSAASAQEWHCAQTLFCPKKVPKGGVRKRRTAPFTPSCLHCTFTSSGKQWLRPASPLHLQTLPWPHFLSPPHPPTEMGLFVKQKDWLLLVKYFKMVCVCIWKQGTYFPKESAFSKGYRKLFLKEIHNYFWNFFALKVSSLQGILIHISSWTIQYMYLFSVLNKKKIQTP